MLVPNLGSTGKVIGAIKGFDSAPDFLKAIPKAVDSNQGFGDWGTNLLHLGDKSAEEALDTAKNMTFYKGLREVSSASTTRWRRRSAFGEDGAGDARGLEWRRDERGQPGDAFRQAGGLSVR